MKNEKSMWVFIFQKYGKFWSVSLKHFIKHKPLISEQCTSSRTINSKAKINVFFNSEQEANLKDSLFRNKRFMLDEMFQWNASKFAILLEYENPHSCFLFFISCYFIFKRVALASRLLYSSNSHFFILFWLRPLANFLYFLNFSTFTLVYF